MIDLENAKNLFVQNDISLATKIEFLKNSELLKTLKIEPKVLSYYVNVKQYQPDQHVVLEGEDSQFIYMIKSGKCRLIKACKITSFDDKITRLIPLDGARLPIEPDEQAHLLSVASLSAYDYFGEGFISRYITPYKFRFLII
jgi:hypothetical protein